MYIYIYWWDSYILWRRTTDEFASTLGSILVATDGCPVQGREYSESWVLRISMTMQRHASQAPSGRPVGMVTCRLQGTHHITAGGQSQLSGSSPPQPAISVSRQTWTIHAKKSTTFMNTTRRINAMDKRNNKEYYTTDHNGRWKTKQWTTLNKYV